MGKRNSITRTSKRVAELRCLDLEKVPTVDAERLPKAKKARFERFRKAISGLHDGSKTTKQAAKVVKCTPRYLLDVVGNFIKIDADDGMTVGYRALVKHRHSQEYFRSKPVNEKSGFAGGLMMFLREHATIHEGLVDFANGERKGAQFRPNQIGLQSLETELLRLCEREAPEIGEDMYPRSRRGKLSRALKNWYVKQYMPKNVLKATRANAGESAATAARQDVPSPFAVVRRPYDRWQLDAYRINVRAKYSVLLENGHWHDLSLSRYWLLVLVDSAPPSATLAWKVVLDKKPNQADVLAVLWQALSGQPKMPRVIWDDKNDRYLDYQDGWGYPSQCIPRLRWAIGGALDLDNALEHLGDSLRNAIMGACGMRAGFGPAYVPKVRAAVEGKFAQMTRTCARHVPGSTGSGPSDPVREIADCPVEERVSVNELNHIFCLHFARTNGQPVTGSAGTSSLRFLETGVERQTLRPVYLTEDKRRAHFFGLSEDCNVIRSGGRIWINCKYKKYTGACLEQFAGRKSRSVQLIARIDTSDLRDVRLFTKEGIEVGVVKCEGNWGRYPHDLRIRMLYFRISRSTGMKSADFLRFVFQHLADRAPRDEVAATQLAHVVEYLRPHISELEAQLRQDIEATRQVRFVRIEEVAAAANDAPEVADARAMQTAQASTSVVSLPVLPSTPTFAQVHVSSRFQSFR